MPRTDKSAKSKRRIVWVGTVVALLAVAGGWVLAASLQIGPGNTETGAGTYHGTALLTYWSETSVGVGTQPSPVPTTLSAAVATPTQLAATGQGYAINAPTAGDIVHFWKFTESTAAPAATEIELQFTVSTGAVPVVTAVTVYIETQATIPATAQVFTLYYDLGSAATTTIVLNSVTEIGQQCSAVGTCP